jgi:hypothetical protein
MTVGELKEWAARVRPDLPTARVVDALAELYRGPGTTYSPALITEHLARAQLPTDEREVMAVLLLLSGPPADVLVAHWFFFDPEGDQEFPLSGQDVEDAVRAGEFIHPIRGEPVSDYLERIGLVYHPGATFDTAMHHEWSTRGPVVD